MSHLSSLLSASSLWARARGNDILDLDRIHIYDTHLDFQKKHIDYKYVHTAIQGARGQAWRGSDLVAKSGYLEKHILLWIKDEHQGAEEIDSNAAYS